MEFEPVKWLRVNAPIFSVTKMFMGINMFLVQLGIIELWEVPKLFMPESISFILICASLEKETPMYPEQKY